MTTHTLLTNALNALNPVYMTLDNESHMHAGYYDGKESHFKLVIVSDDFKNKRLTARHQAVYAIATPFLMAQGGSIHALAIHAYTPDEWSALSSAPDSPNCAGQNKH
ncbi:BolA family transcriptional regulator [Moraxella sp. VT-16-12]|uniref:BolA family protein n=1 Tax=Moraxella sp. VT-16-12 TaxID=2014877 RepID=UPI000B7D2A74|nr:BolA family protein [Moraxella sp. VT-16-12]TWV84614.1 BolA family transcriptional regulator [Moraxella sp. VT-16-12]